MYLSPEFRNTIYAKTEGHCWYCGEQLTPSWQVDHQTPRKRGGSDQPDNLAPACRLCNVRKGNRTIEEYRHRLTVKLENKITEAQEFANEIGLLTVIPENDDNPPSWCFEIDSLLYKAGQIAVDSRPVFYGERRGDHE